MISEDIVEQIKDELIEAGERGDVQFGKIEVKYEMSFQDGKPTIFKRSDGPWERTERL